jgi:hypothetical protein
VSRRRSSAFTWWVAVGVAELAIAIVLLAAGYWYSIFGTAPATALCAYFALKEWEKLGSDSGSSRSRSSR